MFFLPGTVEQDGAATAVKFIHLLKPKDFFLSQYSPRFHKLSKVTLRIPNDVTPPRAAAGRCSLSMIAVLAGPSRRLRSSHHHYRREVEGDSTEG